MPVDTAHSPKFAAMAGWALPLMAVGGASILAAKALAGPLAFALFSAVLLTAGFTIAAVLYGSGSRIGHDRDNAWLAAGALVFLGFAAALLSDGHDALAQLERMQALAVGS